MNLEVSTAPDGRKYAADKPVSCSYCFFWGSKKTGCELDECFYILPQNVHDFPQEDTVEKSECENCPYGKVFPCIGYCLRKIMQELKVRRDAG